MEPIARAGGAWIVAFALASTASAQVHFGTGFESEAAVPAPPLHYSDPCEGCGDHDLANRAGEPIVDSTPASAAAGALAFDAKWVDSRNDVGLGDGDYVGVTKDTSVVGAFRDGSQGYRLSDADGTLELYFGPMDLSGLGAVAMAVDVFVREADWEPDDLVRVTARLDGAPDVALLDTSGVDIDTLGIEGAWHRHVAVIPAEATSARLVVELSSDQAAEEIYLDRVVVVPEPGRTLALAASVALLALLAARPRPARGAA